MRSAARSAGRVATPASGGTRRVTWRRTRDDHEHLRPRSRPHAANFAPLTPVSFVERSAEVFGDLEAVVHGRRRYTWRQTRDRSARLAAALRSFGVGRATTVSAMLPNTPEMVEAHYAVPALNAVLNTLNTRLDAALIAWQMNHCECAVLITDREFAPTMREALRILREVHGRDARRHRRLRQRGRRHRRAPRRA